jgi:hypothetical protein
MVALLVVPPTQAAIIQYGFIDDPTWDPWPGSPLDDSEDAIQAALAERDRWAATRPLLQDVEAAHWRRHARQVGLVVRGDDRDGVALGFANAEPGSRYVARGVRRLRIGPWVNFDSPLALAALLDAMEDPFSGRMISILRGGVSRPLPPALEGAVRVALERLVGPVENYTQQLPPFQIQTRRAAEDILRADANQTALRIFTRDWQSLEPTSASHSPSQFALSLEQTVKSNEQDAITDDTSAFLDWQCPWP